MGRWVTSDWCPVHDLVFGYRLILIECVWPCKTWNHLSTFITLKCNSSLKQSRLKSQLNKIMKLPLFYTKVAMKAWDTAQVQGIIMF